jgi:hypothetical protein
LSESCFPAQIFSPAWYKACKDKGLCLAQRRRDAGWERLFLSSDLCVSASLREGYLVAAERSEAALGHWCNSWLKSVLMAAEGRAGTSVAPFLSF